MKNLYQGLSKMSDLQPCGAKLLHKHEVGFIVVKKKIPYPGQFG
jgi:hypothetical protein